MFTKRRFNIRSKIILGNLVVVFFLIVSVFLVNGRITSLQQEINFISNHDIEVHDVTNQMEKNEFNMETGQRGYIITGSQAYLDMYSDGSIKWVGNYDKLHQLVSDNPNQQKNLESLKNTIELWMSEVGAATIAMKKAGETEELNKFFLTDPAKEYIDQMRSQFEAFLTTEKELTNKRVEQIEHSNYLLKISLYILLVVVSVLSIFMAFITSQSIVRTIKQVIEMIKEMSSQDGEFNKRIEVATRDEISDLGHATNQLVDNFEKFAWLESNSRDIIGAYQGINTINCLAEIFISKVSPLINASYGVVYIREERNMEQEFVKRAAYALYGGEQAGLSFRLGEGLVGQCAQDKRSVVIDQLPNHYFRIASGLGQTTPQSLLIVPVVFMDRVEAVIEFASLQVFTQQQQELIKLIQSNFGGAIHSVSGRMEVERLLNESQMMTEELQMQSEELQSQSEELQMQQEEMMMINENLDKQNQLALIKTNELEKTKEELEAFSVELQKSSQYKSDFLANMSHELRTPLNSILILSQMLAENQHKTLRSEEERFSQTIHEAGKDLLTLIDDILDLSKIEAGKIDVLVSELNVTEIPVLMRLSFDAIAQSKKIAFEINIAEDVPEIINTDGQRLQQILKNLLSNSFKFTEQGTVTLNIEKLPPNLVKQLLPAYWNKQALAFSIIDTGIGIAADKQQLIFEAFRQIDSTISRRYGGTGLGLSISLGFTRLLGGCLVLESEEGKGSKFTLYLPCLSDMETSSGANVLAETAVASALKKPAPINVDNNEAENDIFLNKRVLLVEDDSRNVYALVQSFESKGILIEVATNGQECLDILQDDPSFDLVLMDVMMPVMNGYEAMSAIRKDSVLKGMPIIALTAKAMKTDRQKCLEAGASDYISKPLDMAQLYSLMRVWIK